MAFQWTPGYTEKILSTVLDLVKVGFGALLTWLLAHQSEVRARRSGFKKLLLRFMLTPVVNTISAELMKARDFVLQNPELLQEPAVPEFFAKWLNDPMMMIGGGNLWTKEKLDDLHADIRRLDKTSRFRRCLRWVRARLQRFRGSLLRAQRRIEERKWVR